MQQRAHNFAEAGFRITKDEVGVYQLRLSGGIPARIRRFNRFAKYVLLETSCNAGLAASCLVVCDGILPSELGQIDSALANIYKWRDQLCLEWRGDGPPRLERRAISDRTVSVLTSLDCTPCGLLEGLEASLSESPQYKPFKPKERLIELERDALCWWYQNLPLPLFFHVSGVQPMTALSRACLASEATNLVPSLPVKESNESNPWTTEDSCSELIDAMAIATGSDSSSILIRQALEHISLVEKETDSMAKDRWIDALLKLRMTAASTGPITSLLLAWSIDIIESGTIQQPNPPKRTPHAYLHKALEPLFYSLKKMSIDIDRWDTETLCDMYQGLVQAQAPGSQKTMASALTNFHHFLITWFDAPPLTRSIRADVPLGEVKAHVVWPHQLERALTWIDRSITDGRLAESIHVALHIAKAAASRVSEVIFTRVANVTNWGDWLEIEIAPTARFGRLKSPAAQRRLV
ncbi:MAG: hypothetical protein KGI91_16310, partial [Burkholderiales bacterium]|nr:hypothetical protein [Burkholderiales bacterium]